MSKAKNTFLRFKKQIFEILGVVSLLLIWEFFAIIYNNQEIVPGLGRIFLACFDLLSMKEVHLAFGETLLRTIFAIIISFIIGTVLGLLSGLFEGLRHYLKPIIGFIKLIPTPCIVFLILVFFLKSPNVGSLIITFIVVFPIIYESMLKGIIEVDPFIKMSLRLEGYFKLKCVFKVLLPQTSPYVALGLVNSLSLGVKVSIVSEILMSTDNLWGIGRLIYVFRLDAKYDYLIATTILAALIFLFIDVLISLIKKFFKK